MALEKNGASFDRVAKHLFRHLHDAGALRKNPLVRRFFVRAATRHVANERLALAQVHLLVKEAGDRCRDIDLVEGRECRALRQNAILHRQCLEQRPISEVAQDLGISLKHCYRQRAEICRRVARLVAQYDDMRFLEHTPDLDAFRVALDLAMHRCAFVDSSLTLLECEKLAREAPSPAQSIEAYRIAAYVALYFGDVKTAERYHSTARRTYCDNQGEPLLETGAAPACLDLMASKIAYYRADATTSLALAKRASAVLRSAWHDAPERIRELYVESLYEVAAAACNGGDLSESSKQLCEAEAAIKHIKTSSARLRARIALAVWKVRAHLLLSSAASCTAWQRQRGLTSAFELAYGSGAIPEATAAAVALAEDHAIACNDSEALCAARLALTLTAKQPSDRIRAQTAIELAASLSATRYWAFGLSLLPGRELRQCCDAYHRDLADYVIAKRALRSHRFEDAWSMASKTGHDEFAELALSRGILAATAAHRLGRERDAKALVEAIVPRAEQLRGAPALRDAYNAAATITGEVRFKRRARELSKLLTE